MPSIRSARELGQRIRAARKGAGRSQAEVAAALQVDRTSMTRIELGERGVSTLELVAISEYLRVPIAYLLETPPQAVTSRRTDVTDDATDIERQRFAADVLLDTWARSVEFLRSRGVLDEAPRRLEVPAVRDRRKAMNLADRARAELDIVGPVPAMQETCEKLGLYVFVHDIGINGASRSDDTDFGVAVIRDVDEPGRRRFTAAHELGHHVIGDAYSADFPGSASDRERRIDVFAAQFLLPEDLLRSRVAGREGRDLREVLIDVAAEFRVSWSLVLRVADSARILGPRQPPGLRATPTREEFMRVTGRDVPQDLVQGRYGPRWTRAVLRAEKESLITRVRADELLAGASPFGQDLVHESS